ncbi:MAG: extracellular solute-binding protein [Actinomyces sp.]|jgi:multiple sugar transport system substrate-binding protein|nr:extracellular solute-binding protein [Actinomyces sp.]MCI1787419.1 extracellular solute-binding protein [Actinomyces sp.]MCI1830763.1 extracellular solute-binding protein [Actinomyces sp.]
MRRSGIAALIAVTGAALALAGCSSSSSSGESGSASAGGSTLTIAYQKTSSFHQLDDVLQTVKTDFESANPGVTVNLQPIEAEQDQYFTKLALMNGSKDTAPDVIYEDTFQVMSDAAAGYLLPIDDYLADWSDWAQFQDAAKKAGLGVDGKTYGVSMGTDTRGIYFNKTIFQQAGLPTDWQPTSWDDILSAARTIKEKVSDVTPLSIVSGKAAGEATTMQGFEMLLYGTDSTLYDEDTQKWVTGSKGFTDALTFYKTVADENLGLPLDVALDANVQSRVATDLIPNGKVAMAIDGSWLPGGWIEGDNAWPDWDTTLGFAKMPTQDGAGAGFTSMSGGWLLSVGAQTKDPELAMKFIELALNKENSLTYDTTNSQIAVRDDVAKDDAYLNYNASFEFFSGLVQYTHFRPATPDYSQISSNIQAAVESVVTGDATPEQAASTYDEGLSNIVGPEATESEK